MSIIPSRRSILVSAAILVCLLISSSAHTARAQGNSFDRDRGRIMLREIKNDIRQHYYDPNFRGIDLDARFRTAEERINQATSLGQIFGIIAQVLMEFNDSHLIFLPPQRSARTDYGWQARMIGDAAFVVAVKPGSDAAAKGLKPGDRIQTVDNVGLTRENFWVFQYLYYALRPQPGMRLVAQSPGEQPRELIVMARIRQGQRIVDLMRGGIFDLIREAESEARINRHRYIERAPEVMIWNMPQFDLSEQQVDEMMSRARQHRALILDLRGNPGGSEDTLLRLIGNFFDRDVTVGEIQRRRGREPLVARTHGGDRVFTGRLIVLTDSRSGSSAEIFARVMQIERRGTVVGDRTAGAVMRSRIRDHQLGVDTVIFYGVSVTDADLVMTDGRSLERVGVTPDEILLPTGADLAASRDPVLSRAARMLEINLSPEQAGTMFPIEWQR